MHTARMQRCSAGPQSATQRRAWRQRMMCTTFALTKGARGATIKKGTLVVDAHWYVSTSGDQMRKSYKLMADEKVTIPVASLVQEHNLEWAREMRGGTNCEPILANSSHLALMQHNYSNTK